MAYSSDDEFDGELPDIQLLLEQKISKSGGKTTTPIELRPSLFDPSTPPKAKPKPKPRSKSAELGLVPKSKAVTKKKVEALVVDRTPRVLKEVKVKKVTTVKKQIRKPTAQEITTTKETVVGTGRKTGGGSVACPEVLTSSGLSDYASAAEYAEQSVQPTPRRRRLVQKKYLPSDDEDEEQEEGKEQETVKKAQRRFFGLTSSDSDEELPRTHRPKASAESTVSEDDGFESQGSRSTLDDICGAVLT